MWKVTESAENLISLSLKWNKKKTIKSLTSNFHKKISWNIYHNKFLLKISPNISLT
jgi:hypothetical protein